MKNVSMTSLLEKMRIRRSLIIIWVFMVIAFGVVLFLRERDEYDSDLENDVLVETGLNWREIEANSG